MAQQAAEGLGQRTLTAGPGPALPGHDEGADDGAVLQRDGLDQDSPGDARDDTREGADRILGPQKADDALTDMGECVSRTGDRPRLRFESGYGLVEAAHDLDDLRT